MMRQVQSPSTLGDQTIENLCMVWIVIALKKQNLICPVQ
jgi:hypothetical protein